MTRLAAPLALLALTGSLLAADPLPARAADAAPQPDAAPAATAAPAVTVVAATRRALSDSLTITGTLVAGEEILVGVDIEGLKIEAILADAGDRVEAGAVLARLARDTIDVQLAQNASQAARADGAVAQAMSQITEATAVSGEAELALQRTRALADKGVVSRDVLDARIAAATSANARLDMARHGLDLARADRALVEAQRREIELRLAKTEIRAPAAGLVLERSARLGAVASAAGGPLFRIAEDGLVELAADVPEASLQRLKAGQAVTVTTAAGDRVAGTVRLIEPRVDPVTRLGMVRVAFAADAPVTVGSYARGTVEIASREGVAVPVSAVLGTGEEARIMVVVGDRVAERVVRTGLSSDGFVEIMDGIAEGENVVARAGTFLRDGDAVRPVSEGSNG